MKNIHVIPTDKPSRLRYNLSNVLVLTKEPYRDYSKQVNQHIYITSDEEIKEGDWVYHKILKSVFQIDLKETSQEYIDKRINILKIILTTDQELINDGVQKIDDTFLEWFVKNPSCEEVETYHIGYVNAYNIIIPKEEPKCLYDKPSSCENSECRVLNKCNGDRVSHKQETLEEAAETISDFIKRESKSANESVGIVKGVKWQQERRYSEEEVIKALDREEWINLFKNNSKEEILEMLIDYKFPL